MNLPLNLPHLSLTLPPESPQFINLCDTSDAAALLSVQQELTQGLLAEPAHVAPKYFYDPLGSRLFEAITALDEYYPTRTEAAIFKVASTDIAAVVAAAGIAPCCLVDLGAGNCAKATALIPYLQPRQYVPVDISTDFLCKAAKQVQYSFPTLDIVGVGLDFSSNLTLPAEVQKRNRIFFYPGSSLGNFHPDQALQFLKRVADPTQGAARGLLLGIDLVKDTATLEAAYDDALGVTAAFNKNLLRNLNHLLQTDFDLRQWQHVARFDRALSRIEMHLEARSALTVRWPGQARQFAAGQRIHTECSYKYTVAGMTDLLRQAGFNAVQHWSDPKQWFAVFWAGV